MTKTIGDTAVVIGAGMSGLTAAAALSDFFSRVVILERDELPAKPAHRLASRKVGTRMGCSGADYVL